jgi:hypothetical protein
MKLQRTFAEHSSSVELFLNYGFKSMGKIHFCEKYQQRSTGHEFKRVA